MPILLFIYSRYVLSSSTTPFQKLFRLQSWPCNRTPESYLRCWFAVHIFGVNILHVCSLSAHFEAKFDVGGHLGFQGSLCSRPKVCV